MAERLDFQCGGYLTKSVYIHSSSGQHKQGTPVSDTALCHTQSSWWNKEPHLYMIRVTPLNTHCCWSLVLLERYCSMSTGKITLSSQPVVHPASTLIFRFRRVYQIARMQMKRKYIACKVNGLLHTLLNIKGWLFFFQSSTRSLIYYSTFTHASYSFWCPITPFPLGILGAGLLFMKQRS